MRLTFDVENGATPPQARTAAERVYVAHVLKDAKGNKSEAARRMGMNRCNLFRVLDRLGLR